MLYCRSQQFYMFGKLKAFRTYNHFLVASAHQLEKVFVRLVED